MRYLLLLLLLTGCAGMRWNAGVGRSLGRDGTLSGGYGDHYRGSDLTLDPETYLEVGISGPLTRSEPPVQRVSPPPCPPTPPPPSAPEGAVEDVQEAPVGPPWLEPAIQALILLLVGGGAGHYGPRVASKLKQKVTN